MALPAQEFSALCFECPLMGLCPRIMDNKLFVDTARHPEQHLIATAVDAAAGHGLDWRHVEFEPRKSKDLQADATLELQVAGQWRRLTVEAKAGLRPALLGLLFQRLAPLGRDGLLVADYVTPPMAERLREQGIQFIDAAGNAFIDQPPLYVWVKGEKPRKTAKPRHATGRAFAPTGLTVIFALLCRPGMVAAPYREIADVAGVAHGTVGWVMPELTRLGFLAEIGGQRRLLQGERLLDTWAEAYLRTLRPKLLLARYRPAELRAATGFDYVPYGHTVGGEVAAQREVGVIEPATVTLYAPAIDPKLLATLRLRADEDGPLEVLERFWPFDDGDPLTPAPLIYADLLGIGDERCLEAAAKIKETCLARLARP
ncbi:MAG: type IV toxin-antitoxin system AbiEi family antitoxin [Lysobacteraceae bacterium]